MFLCARNVQRITTPTGYLFERIKNEYWTHVRHSLDRERSVFGFPNEMSTYYRVNRFTGWLRTYFVGRRRSYNRTTPSIFTEFLIETPIVPHISINSRNTLSFKQTIRIPSRSQYLFEALGNRSRLDRAQETPSA